MDLEKAIKFHSPNSSQLTDAPKATASEALTSFDVLGALGMVQRRSPLGFSAFNAKIELNESDKKRAIQLLTQHGLKHCGKVAALRKLDTKSKLTVVHTLATFAFASWSRSAATPGARCKDCHGTGRACNREVTERTGVLTDKECDRCTGKGFSKLPAASVYRAISSHITSDQWKRGVTQFYESLITELDKSESHANAIFRSVTSSFEKK